MLMIKFIRAQTLLMRNLQVPIFLNKALSQNVHLLRSRSLTILTYFLKYAPAAHSLRPRIWTFCDSANKMQKTVLDQEGLSVLFNT